MESQQLLMNFVRFFDKSVYFFHIDAANNNFVYDTEIIEWIKSFFVNGGEQKFRLEVKHVYLSIDTNINFCIVEYLLLFCSKSCSL